MISVQRDPHGLPLITRTGNSSGALQHTTKVDVLQTGGQRGDAVRDGARQFIRAEIQGPEERQHCTPT